MPCPSLLSALAVAALLAMPLSVRAACTGDCDHDGAVRITELVTLVDIALNGGGTTLCSAGDTNGDGVITVDELIGAVGVALQGCPATPTATPSATASGTTTPEATSTASASATVSATASGLSTALPTDTLAPSPSASTTPTPVLSGTPTRTVTTKSTASLTVTATATPTPTHSATLTAVSTGTPTPLASSSATVTLPPSPTPTPTATGTFTRTATRSSTPSTTATATRTSSATRTTTPIPTASHTATPTVTVTDTRTTTPTESPTSTATPTPGLGVRHFSLNPQTSEVELLPDTGTFTGFSGWLDLAAGVPDPVTGLAVVDIVGASDFLSVQIGPFVLCIKPLLVPVSGAGVLACNGGFDLGITASQDHNIGIVGVNGFTADDCSAAGGTVETASDPHPGVCNGPIEIGPSPEADSGVGALLLAPDARFGTQGLQAEVTIDFGPCSQHGAGEPTVFGFVSGVSRAEILDANKVAGAVLAHDEHGENFSCPMWTQENGPGRLVLSVPTLDGSASGDLITVFVLDD